jgi:hypothetical protein
LSWGLLDSAEQIADATYYFGIAICVGALAAGITLAVRSFMRPGMGSHDDDKPDPVDTAAFEAARDVEKRVSDYLDRGKGNSSLFAAANYQSGTHKWKRGEHGRSVYSNHYPHNHYLVRYSKGGYTQHCQPSGSSARYKYFGSPLRLVDWVKALYRKTSPDSCIWGERLPVKIGARNYSKAGSPHLSDLDWPHAIVSLLMGFVVTWSAQPCCLTRGSGVT